MFLFFLFSQALAPIIAFAIAFCSDALNFELACLLFQCVASATIQLENLHAFCRLLLSLLAKLLLRLPVGTLSAQPQTG